MVRSIYTPQVGYIAYLDIKHSIEENASWMHTLVKFEIF